MYFFIVKRKYLVALLLLCAAAVLGTCIFMSADVQTAGNVHEGVRVPILMYHSILKNPAAAGKYVVSPQTLEADLTYLKEHGYTSIQSSDLVAYVREGKPLPEKPVIITFDDGHANNLLYALPILEKLDMRGVICIVGKYSEDYSTSEDHNPNYAYLSWEEIRTLLESGRFEIANHSYDMHGQGVRKGTMKKLGEDLDTYNAKLKEDLLKTQSLLQENCKITPIAFSYPFGSVCKDSVPLIRELGFAVSYGCAEKVNYITDADSLYCLGRFNRPSGISTAEFMKSIEK